jgi:oligosaccharyltransferase complex subunit alpha (ribophorin I)
MDTMGRSTLVLTAHNLVDDLRDAPLVITYTYPSAAMLRKPLTIFAGLVGVFTTAWVIGRLDVSIGRKTAG